MVAGIHISRQRTRDSTVGAYLRPLVPIQMQQIFAEAASPEGKLMKHDEATLHVATELAKAFGYDFQVNLAFHTLRNIYVKYSQQRHD